MKSEKYGYLRIFFLNFLGIFFVYKILGNQAYGDSGVITKIVIWMVVFLRNGAFSIVGYFVNYKES